MGKSKSYRGRPGGMPPPRTPRSSTNDGLPPGHPPACTPVLSQPTSLRDKMRMYSGVYTLDCIDHFTAAHQHPPMPWPGPGSPANPRWVGKRWYDDPGCPGNGKVPTAGMGRIEFSKLYGRPSDYDDYDWQSATVPVTDGVVNHPDEGPIEAYPICGFKKWSYTPCTYGQNSDGYWHYDVRCREAPIHEQPPWSIPQHPFVWNDVDYISIN